MANNDNCERIERYLREQMTPEENEAFLKDLKKDEDLREEAQMMALMIKGMKEELAKQDAEISEKVLALVEPQKKANTIRMLRWTLSIAAMLVVVLGVGLLWNKPSDTDTLFNAYYTSYTIQGTPRGGDSDVEVQLAALFNQVGTAKEITPVINELQSIFDAIDSEYEYSLYADDISWYLALAYLKDGKQEEAKEMLKPLVENGDAKAIKLMEDIDNK